jgi:hypothetical protein
MYSGEGDMQLHRMFVDRIMLGRMGLICLRYLLNIKSNIEYMDASILLVHSISVAALTLALNHQLKFRMLLIEVENT